jgi:hypothetical protein
MSAPPSGCVICHHTVIAVLALFVPAAGGPPVPYVVCHRCIAAFSPDVLAGMVEQFLGVRP